MHRLTNPHAPKQHKVTKLNALIWNAARVKEDLHKARASRSMRDLIRVGAASKAARVAFIAKSRKGAPVIANDPQMRERRSKSQDGMRGLVKVNDKLDTRLKGLDREVTTEAQCDKPLIVVCCTLPFQAFVRLLLGHLFPSKLWKFLLEPHVLEYNMMQAALMKEVVVKMTKDNLVAVLHHVVAFRVKVLNGIRGGCGNSNPRGRGQRGEITCLNWESKPL